MTTIELCCGTADEVRMAHELGADRIELCSALACGGVTPSLGLVEFALELGLETMAMVRSREGNFCYSHDEVNEMVRDAHHLVRHGVSGLVFGFLDENLKVDVEVTKRLVDIADGRPTMIHRASDALADQDEGLDTLAAIGVKRVLTSGQGGNAIHGTARLMDLVRHFGDRLEFVAGGGIRGENVTEILRTSGVPAIHFASRKDADTPGYAGVADPSPDRALFAGVKEAVRAYDSTRA